MALRVVFFSDTHLGFDLPVRPRVETLRRGPDFFANFERVLDHVRRTRPDLLVHGGDVFFRSKVHPSIVDRAYAALLDVAAAGIPIALVPGNHERAALPPSLLLGHPNVLVFDRPRTFVLDVRDRRIALSGFPYVRNVRNGFGDALREARPAPLAADHRLLCFHHAVEGAVVGPGHFTFRHAADVIARRSLPPGFDLILSGHIHRHQVLDLPTPVVYCGSIERTSFAEQHEIKGFCEITLADHAPPRIRFHTLPARPMIDFDARPYATPAALLAALAEQGRPGAIVRVKLDAYPAAPLSRALTRVSRGIVQLSCPLQGARTG